MTPRPRRSGPPPGSAIALAAALGACAAPEISPRPAAAPPDAAPSADLAPAAVDLATDVDDAAPPPTYRLVAYSESWSEPLVADGHKARLARVAPYVGVVNLAFMQPDSTYVRGGPLSTTGLRFPFDGAVLARGIATLRARQPATRLLVAVGGASYDRWDAFHPDAVAAFVEDFGLDGVDLDYEPADFRCTLDAARVHCDSDAQFIAVVRAMRAALPRPALLSVAAKAGGALGEGTFPPVGAPHAGNCINVLRAEGESIDWLNVMAYNAPDGYDPAVGLAAFRRYYAGPVMMGVSVPPESWGGHRYTVAEVEALADTVRRLGGGGLMLWSLQKRPRGHFGPENPTASAIAQAACARLDHGDCAAPLL